MYHQLICSCVLCSIIVRGDYEYLVLEMHDVNIEIATLHAMGKCGKLPQYLVRLIMLHSVFWVMNISGFFSY